MLKERAKSEKLVRLRRSRRPKEKWKGTVALVGENSIHCCNLMWECPPAIKKTDRKIGDCTHDFRMGNYYIITSKTSN